MRSQHVGHTPRPGPNFKDERSSAKHSELEKLGCRTIEKEMRKIVEVSSDAARSIRKPMCKCGSAEVTGQHVLQCPVVYCSHEDYAGRLRRKQ